MASPPILTPSGTTGFNVTDYRRGFDEATYQRMNWTPTISDYGGRISNSGTVRKKKRVTGTTLAQSADGTSLTASDFSDTPISITPVGTYIMLQWSANERAQVPEDLNAEGRADIERALAEATETTGLQAVQSLTKFSAVPDVNATVLRQAVGNLVGNTNGMAMPGTPGAPQIFGLFTNKQYPNLAAIPEVNQANFRGDSESPYVKGIWVNGFGFLLNLSTVIANDANGDHNVIYLSEAFVVGWNQHNDVTDQEFELTYKLIAFNNVGYQVRHDLRAFAIRTSNNAL